jgi:hypothetical protein
MSVRACSHCRREYWAYPGHWPAGYCSTPCFNDRGRRVTESGELAPEQPLSVVAELREHLTTMHATADLTAWFPHCRRCEALQERLTYAVREAG